MTKLKKRMGLFVAVALLLAIILWITMVREGDKSRNTDRPGTPAPLPDDNRVNDKIRRDKRSAMSKIARKEHRPFILA